MPDPEFPADADLPQASQPRPGTQPSAPSASHYAAELPYAEELQAMLAGHYIVEGFLGQGGMGAVYKGLQLPLKRPVAIKILQKQTTPDDFAFEERFKREAYAMASLTHPHIVQVYDCGDAGENFLFISMELLEGGDLSDAIKGGKVTPEVALKLIGQICDGLQAAHERGIVHRDIKPANIFLTADGRAKVADFGLAKKFDVKSTFVTRTGLGMGTPDYAAPEQFEPELGLDHRADIYALGVMFYQMLTGKLPRGVYKMPSQLVAVDPRLDEVVSRAMMSEREDRWQSAAEMKAAITSIVTQPLQQPTAVRTAAVPVHTGRVPTAPRPSAPRPVQTGAVLAAAPKPSPAPVEKSKTRLIIGVLGAAVVGAGAFFLLKKPKPEPVIATNATVATPTSPGPASTPPVPSRPPVPGENWVDGLAPWVADPQNADKFRKVPEGYVFTKRNDVVAGGKLQNLAIRATVRNINWYADLRAITHSKAPLPRRFFSYMVMVRGAGEMTLHSDMNGEAGAKKSLGKRALPPGFDRDGRHEMELRIENGIATALLDGQVVAFGPADDKGIGGAVLNVAEGMIVEKFEYLDLGTATIAPAIAPAPALPDDVLTYSGHRYQLLQGDMTWEQADAKAKAMGGHLATLTTNAECDALASGFDGTMPPGGAWIGGLMKNNETWAWVTGEPFDFKRWQPSQPDRSGRHMLVTALGLWDDAPSAGRRSAFIVEWEEDPGASKPMAPAVATLPATPAAPAMTLPPAPTTPKQTVDIISLIDPVKDRTVSARRAPRANHWEKAGTVLTYKSDGAPGRITAPVSLNEARDYEVGLLLRRHSGSDPFVLVLPVSMQKQAGLEFNQGGIEFRVASEQNVKIGNWPPNAAGDMRVVVRLRYAPDGKNGSLAVSINGQPVGKWEGPLGEVGGMGLEFHPEFPGQQVLSFASAKDGFAFAAWQLRVYEGEAKVLRTAPIAGTTPPAATPPAPASMTRKAGKELFDGRTLKGWRVQGSQDAFVVEDRCIKATGSKCTLMFSGNADVSADMKDFDLTMKVKTQGQANSGVFIHCRRNTDGQSFINGVEVQIANENQDPQKTGSVWSIQPVKEIIVHDNEWFDYRISVKDKTVTAYINGKKVNEWTQPAGWNGAQGKPDAKLGDGTIGLQSNGGSVWFKDIEIRVP